jgi:hypothetical protein
MLLAPTSAAWPPPWRLGRLWSACAAARRVGAPPVIIVTPATSISFFRSELEDFLHAPIGMEKDEMPLSVLSALARLGLDPWKEAAELSELPRDHAAETGGADRAGARRAMGTRGGSGNSAPPDQASAIAQQSQRSVDRESEPTSRDRQLSRRENTDLRCIGRYHPLCASTLRPAVGRRRHLVPHAGAGNSHPARSWVFFEAGRRLICASLWRWRLLTICDLSHGACHDGPTYRA